MRQFPNQIAEMAGAYNVKAAFVSALDAVNPNECKNCGGVGTISLFLATKGPFQSPSSSREDCNKYESGVGWWVGQHYSVNCPDCGGVGITISETYSRPPSDFRPADYKQIQAQFRSEAIDRGEGEYER